MCILLFIVMCFCIFISNCHLCFIDLIFNIYFLIFCIFIESFVEPNFILYVLASTHYLPRLALLFVGSVSLCKVHV